MRRQGPKGPRGGPKAKEKSGIPIAEEAGGGRRARNRGFSVKSRQKRYR